ncbi:hypothetical protein JL721_11395 [Aureococcus anophagefferens]|nr:hypothetical protein JL721_11395 [Aureococcus anophagefferens]
MLKKAQETLRGIGRGPAKGGDALRPTLEGPLLVMTVVDGGKAVSWEPRHTKIYADARFEIYAKAGDARPLKTEKLTDEHFVADAAGFQNGWQISDFESVLYLAAASREEKTFWMHAVAGVIRRLMEPLDALPPQYAAAAITRLGDADAPNVGPRPAPPALPPGRAAAARPPPPGHAPGACGRGRRRRAAEAEDRTSRPWRRADRRRGRGRARRRPRRARGRQETNAALEGDLAALAAPRRCAPAGRRDAESARSGPGRARGRARGPGAAAARDRARLESEVAAARRADTTARGAPPPRAAPRVETPEQRLEKASASLNTCSKTAAIWAKRIADGREEQKTNVFSKHYVAGAGAAPGKGADYGRPPPGSETEKRWQRGKAWVDEQIAGLIKVIRDIGDTDAATGTTTVKFGALFYTYADISDSLVGIMMRAKKRKRLYYEGDMLFQGSSDNVIVSVPEDA